MISGWVFGQKSVYPTVRSGELLPQAMTDKVVEAQEKRREMLT